MKVIPVFFIFILATSCSTFKVPVMSRQLKVAYQTTAFENHGCNQVVYLYFGVISFKGNFTLISASLQTLSLQEEITCLQTQNFMII